MMKHKPYECGIGPQLSKQKQIEINKKVKKLIHYDCTNVGYEDEDVPGEDEVYIKENLLTRKGAENITEPADDLSIVNINVSVLYSSEGGENSNSNSNHTNNSNNSNHANNNSKNSSHHSNNCINSNISNSKNSVTYTYSSSSKKISASISNSKLSKNSALASNGQNSSLQNRTEKENYQIINTSNTVNTNNSNSKESSNKSDLKQIREVINKRKSLIEKQKQLGNKVLGDAISNLIELNHKKKENINEVKQITVESPEELLDTVPELNGTTQNKNFKNNVKITNITNIIVGANSFDIKNMKTTSNDTMLRDIKALHLITQKALSTQSKHNPIDSIDDERRSFINFHNISSKKALFIEDNSDLPAGSVRHQCMSDHYNSRESSRSNSINFDGEDKNKKQIINIININNNYNIGNINMTNISNKNINQNIFTNLSNFSNSGSNSNQTKKSFRTVNISNYKKNLSNIQNNINSTSIPNNNTNINLNITNDPSIECGKSNISSKTLKKLIPKNTQNVSSTTKTLKDIIKSVKSDNRAKEKFIKFTGK